MCGANQQIPILDGASMRWRFSTDSRNSRKNNSVADRWADQLGGGGGSVDSPCKNTGSNLTPEPKSKKDTPPQRALERYLILNFDWLPAGNVSKKSIKIQWQWFGISIDIQLCTKIGNDNM